MVEFDATSRDGYQFSHFYYWIIHALVVIINEYLLILKILYSFSDTDYIFN